MEHKTKPNSDIDTDPRSETTDSTPTKSKASTARQRQLEKLRGLRPDWKGREFWRVVLVSFICLAVLVSAVTGYLYASSPLSVREPLLEHYHFRMQILVNGKAENFGDAKYQTGYAKDNCNVALPSEPIHFHDNKNQFVHIHWEGMTGGQVLKYYGWNFIGGQNDALGFRFDNFPALRMVRTHGDTLPTIPNDAKFYVYLGDENSYKAKSLDDFTKQDLEKFFGVTSNFPGHKLNQQKRPTSLLNNISEFIQPTAHADEGSHDGMPGMDHGQTELKRINNLLGNVVIFAQTGQPTDQQIKDRFNQLEPLGTSTCGG